MAEDGPPEDSRADAARASGTRADGAGMDGARPDGTRVDGAGGPFPLPRRPTLKTIAALTGLAVPTVSRALGGAPDLAADTKALVRRVAAELGYVPDRAGVRLRTGRTNVIALVLSTETEMMNQTAKLISSLAATLQGTAFHLNVTPFSPADGAAGGTVDGTAEGPMKPIRHIVETGLADAVIFNQTEPGDARAAWLMERGFPFATHGRTRWSASHAWFDFDNEAWAAMGVRRLAALGRRQVAVLAPPLRQNHAQDILRGALGHEPGGVEVRIIEGATCDAGHALVREAVDGALAEGADGLISASPTGAMAAVAAIEGRGLLLGRDVDLFAKEAIPFLRLFRPGILAVREDVGRAGAVLARAAMQAIRAPGEPPLQELEVPDDHSDEDGERQA